MTNDLGQAVNPTPRMTVCAITCRRPEGLERLLGGLAAQEFTEHPPLVKTVIVDNNPDASARATSEKWRDRLGGPLTYSHEPRPGIAAARNRALDSVDEDSQWIVFIDDDEVPSSDWLESLLRGQRTYDADVVSGLVVPYFKTPPPRWVRRGGFFDIDHRRTGARLTQAQTNNVMFRAAIVRELDLRFDERFPRGSDTVFFRRIADAGYSIVRVNEARVEEWIAEERVSESWLIDRRHQSGVLHATIYRELMSRREDRARFAAKLTHKVLVGSSYLVLQAVLPQHVVVRARCRLAFSLGALETVQPRGTRRLQAAIRAAVRSVPGDTPAGHE